MRAGRRAPLSRRSGFLFSRTSWVPAAGIDRALVAPGYNRVNVTTCRLTGVPAPSSRTGWPSAPAPHRAPASRYARASSIRPPGTRRTTAMSHRSGPDHGNVTLPWSVTPAQAQYEASGIPPGPLRPVGRRRDGGTDRGRRDLTAAASWLEKAAQLTLLIFQTPIAAATATTAVAPNRAG